MLLLCATASIGSTASGQNNINREYKLKSVYLYKFATYVTFPDTAFQNANSPFVIGILGPDPLGKNLQAIAKIKKIGNREIVVRNYTSADKIKNCHILFISKKVPEAKQVAALKLLGGRNMLLVGETPNFLKDGGVISFEVEHNRIKNNISKSAYEREKLEVSARLLQICNIEP